MKKITPIRAAIVATTFALSAQAAARHAISAAEVAAALAGAGITVAPAQVTLLSGVVANSPSPALQVRSFQRWNSDNAMVRMECANSADCLPFFVSVRLGSATPAPATPPVFSSVPSTPRVQPQPKYAVRVGTPATLLLDGDHVHIRIAVTCLTNGAAGDTVRAETPDHQKTFLAQVAGEGILRGHL